MTAYANWLSSTGINSTLVQFDPANQSAFGTLEIGELTPVLQLDFIYGINTQTGASAVVSTGVVDTNGGRLRLQSGVNAAGSAIFNSRRTAKYRPGQGITARFTPIFTTGVANSTQIMGAGNAVDGYFFGFNGATFGILHRINSVDTWVAQADWNGDKCNGSGASGFTWDKTKGTPVMIKYPFLGFGDAFFFVQNPTSGLWILAHTIRYANTVATLQLTNPCLHFYAQSINSGNTSNLIMYCGSVGFFISGIRSFVGNPKWAADNNKASITTETNIISLKNATTYNGVTNRSLIRLHSISCGSSAANGIAAIRLKIGVTLGGSPAYTPVAGSTADNGVTITSGNSVASYDVAGTTILNGTFIYTITLDNPNSQLIDLTPYDIFIAPGEVLTVSGFSSISSTIAVGLNWSEDL